MTSHRTPWLVPAGLILLSLVPVVAGSVRVAELASGPEITPENARYVADPLPVVLHIVSATVFALAGAFQFVPSMRRPRGWHRWAGRALVPSGLLVAGTGIWMTFVYPGLPGDGPLLAGMRLAVGPAIAAFLVLGLVAVRRRRFARHRAWMIRGYALAQGAGTQVFTSLPYVVITGAQATGTPRALLLGLGWLINIAVAEAVIRGGLRARVPGARRVIPTAASRPG